MTNGNEPAMPTKARLLNDGDILQMQTGDMGEYQMIGLTKREHFAAIILQGLMTKATHTSAHKEYAIQAIAYADALIKELNKTNNENKS